MANEIREYIRAAQAAEVRGDKDQAIELLKKAATIYRGEGNTERALQMLRHASRLDGDRQDIADEVRRLEWIPGSSIRRAVDTDADGDEETRRALAPLDAIDAPPPMLPASDGKGLIERGPTRADPAVAAWCSFCCKPKTEVGDLVAGPAGAFICAACLSEGAGLLGAPAEATKPIAPSRAPARILEVFGQAAGLAQLEAALSRGCRRVLLVGPAGSGKTTCLKQLERAGRGVRVTALEEGDSVAADQRVLLDQAEQISAGDLLMLSEAGLEHTLLIACRGDLGSPAIWIGRTDARLPVFSTQEVVAATGGKVPLELAEAADAVVAFEALSVEALLEIASTLRPGSLSPDLDRALVEQAVASGRGAHELHALLARVPSGEWTVEATRPEVVGGASKKRRRKAGG